MKIRVQWAILVFRLVHINQLRFGVVFEQNVPLIKVIFRVRRVFCCWLSFKAISCAILGILHSGKSIAHSHMFQSSLTWREEIRQKSILRIRSIDRANTYRIHFVLFCCISFRTQVMKIWKNEREQLDTDVTNTTKVLIFLRIGFARFVKSQHFQLKEQKNFVESSEKKGKTIKPFS